MNRIINLLIRHRQLLNLHVLISPRVISPTKKEFSTPVIVIEIQSPNLFHHCFEESILEMFD